jgi:acetyl-CoA carboxylase carboxyl transferase subunit alpha
MLEHAVYSVISPEGCASILWKNASYADKAAEALKMTAQDMLELKVVDEVIPEPSGGAHRNYEDVAESIRMSIEKHLGELKTLSPEELVEDRYRKFRNMGEFTR